MPWARTDVREQRVKFVVRAASGKEGMSALCREFGISRPTGYRWRKRFVQAGSVIALQERSRRPVHSPARTAPAWEERVVALRREHGWGAKKIAVLLSEAGTALPLITINRILKRRGLVENEPRQYEASRRFERAAPNQLWQMDGKGEYRVSDGTCYPLSILDDHSRFAVGLYGLPNFTAELVHGCVVLVSYRHMYERELDLQRRSTRPLVVSREVDGEGRPPSGLPASSVNPQTNV